MSHHHKFVLIIGEKSQKGTFSIVLLFNKEVPVVPTRPHLGMNPPGKGTFFTNEAYPTNFVR
jgi:hypothetical protein